MFCSSEAVQVELMHLLLTAVDQDFNCSINHEVSYEGAKLATLELLRQKLVYHRQTDDLQKLELLYNHMFSETIEI